MLNGSPIPSGVFSSLTFRLLAVLTIALIPLGAIAVYQTYALSKELRERAFSDLLNRARQESAGEHALFLRSFGATYTLADTSRSLDEDRSACERLMRRFVADGTLHNFAGVVTPDGEMTCSAGTDLELAAVMASLQEPQPFTARVEGDDETGSVIVGTPVTVGGVLSHFVIVGLPVERLAFALDTDEAVDLVSRAIVDAGGQPLLGVEGLPASVADVLRVEGRLLLEENGGQVWEAPMSAGGHIWTIVPLYRDTLYVADVWNPDAIGLGRAGVALPPWVFPILMLIATLLVTYFSINRMVVRHVRILGQRMRRFSRNRRIGEIVDRADQPVEFAEMNDNFRTMAESILRDEADLENAIHEKNLLLREVHHRVKNNLQLIASIMNMQIRKSRHSETGEVIRRLQDRVLGLATVHRQIYKAASMARIPVDELIDRIIDQAVQLDRAREVDVTRDLSPVTLPQDIAVPFALLASEAVNNAIRHCGKEGEEGCWLSVTLEQRSGTIELEVTNTIASNSGGSDPIQLQSRGLGNQLIQAFALQLGANVSRSSENGRYVLRVSMPDKADFETDSSVFETIDLRRESAA